SLCKHLAAAYGADVAFLAEQIDDRPGWARVVASWFAGDAALPEGREFALEGTPCSLVPELDVVVQPEGTVERFPSDKFIARHGLDGYLAVALRAADGALLGHIGVASRRALEPDEADVVALRIFAARAARRRGGDPRPGPPARGDRQPGAARARPRPASRGPVRARPRAGARGPERALDAAVAGGRAAGATPARVRGGDDLLPGLGGADERGEVLGSLRGRGGREAHQRRSRRRGRRRRLRRRRSRRRHRAARAAGPRPRVR